MALLEKRTLYTLLLVCACIGDNSFAYETSARLSAELQLADLELIDVCEDLANGLKLALLENNFKDKISAEQTHGHLLRSIRNNLKKFENIPDEVERNWTFLVTPGDGVLPKDDWDTLVSYHNANEELVSVIKVPCLNNTDGCAFTKADYQSMLSDTRDLDLLNGTWFAWQHVFNSNAEQNPTILEIVKKAAVLNEKDDVTSYWEYLNDFVDGYSTARQFWEEIKPLYIKLHEFVKTRLYKFYNLKSDSDTPEIPVYILGSNFGEDWSNIANLVLPHPQLHYDVEFSLKYKDLREIYLLAENLTDITSLGKLGDKFWLNSRFNMTDCGPQLVTYCSQEYSEVYDCNESTWKTYLDAHEAAFQIALRNQDYVSLMRQQLRYSSVDDAVGTLGLLLSIEDLEHHGIVSKNAFNNTDEDDPMKMTRLLLTALRILPRLAYYLAVDEWRLSEIETPSNDSAASWWQFRRERQLVRGVTGVEKDFLRDEYVTSNKPYISKFFGGILAFQFLDYYRSQLADSRGSIAVEIGKDPNFLSMIKDRPTTDWSYLLTLNYGFNLSPSSLLQYFKPLLKYLENAPPEQVPVVTTTTTAAAPHMEDLLRDSPMKSVDMNTWLKDKAPSDDPAWNATNLTRRYSTQSEGGSLNNVTMYSGIGILVFVSCLLVVVFGYKHVAKSRRTNNRRFAR